jgi:hypothetical protein
MPSLDYYDRIHPDGVTAIICIICLLGGLIVAFHGAKILPLTVFVVTFCFVSYFFLGACGDVPFFDEGWRLYVLDIVVAGIAGIAAALIVELGLFVIGLAGGAALGYIGYLAFLHYADNPSHVVLIIVVVICAIIGAVIAFKVEHVAIVILTAIFGAFLFVTGVDIASARQLVVPRVEDGHFDRTGWILLAVWLFLSIAGIIVQLSCITRQPRRARAVAQPVYVTNQQPIASAV